MAKRTLTLELSSKSFEKTIKEIEEYKKRIISKTKELSKRLAIEGIMIAKAEVTTLDAVFTGELFDSIVAQKISDIDNGSIWMFIANCEHAAYVEFGTGYVGEENPYKGHLPDGVVWNYKVGEQLLANAEKGIYGWFYYRDGQWWFTEGMESRPFMTRAEIGVIDKVVKIAMEVFSR